MRLSILFLLMCMFMYLIILDTQYMIQSTEKLKRIKTRKIKTPNQFIMTEKNKHLFNYFLLFYTCKLHACWRNIDIC